MNKAYKYITTLTLSLSTVLGATAQTPTLTLEECRALAIENNLNLKSSNLQISAAEDIVKAYRSNNLPKLSLSSTYVYSTASFSEAISGGLLPVLTPDMTTGEMVQNGTYAYMPDIEFDFEVGSVFNAGLQLAQPIYMGGKISTASRLAQLGVDVACIERRRTEMDVIVAADEAFYTYLKVEELLRSADAYRTVVDEFERTVANMLSKGMCTKNDLLKVQVRVNEAELQQLKARNGLLLARMNLCYAIGLPLTTQELQVVDDLDFRGDINRDLDVSERPEFELLSKSIEAKRLEMQLAQSDLRPSLTALASYGYTYGMSVNGETIFGSNPSFTGGVTLNVPILNWGEGRRKVSAARSEVAIAENRRTDLEQMMTLELMQSINVYYEAQAEVSLMERTLQQTEENLRQSGNSYEAGMETLSEYLEAQALWQKAMGDLIESRSNQRLAYMRYCRSRGSLLE